MNTTSSTIVQRVWNYCNVLRDDGMSYGDYVEQLTYLLFLKMADERTQPLLGKPSAIPAELRLGQPAADATATTLESHYRQILDDAGQASRGCSASSSARPRTRSRTRPSCGG